MAREYNDTRRDPDADTGGRWFDSLMFIEQLGAGKRQVEDRQEFITRSESKRYRAACRLEVRDRQNGQAGGLSVRAGKRAEAGGLEKRD